MKFKRITSMLLAVAMLCGAFAIPMSLGVSAASTAGGGLDTSGDYGEETDNALEKTYVTAADMLRSDYMQLTTRRYGYELYCNPYTGEIAYKNIATGQIITSNPTNLANIHETTKASLLSQLEVRFTDTAGKTTSMYSFTDAAQRGQIKVKTIRDGLRVEYTMGRIDTTYLLPIYIEESRFNSLIREPAYAYLATLEGDNSYDEVQFYIDKLISCYTLCNPNDENLNEATIAAMKEKYEVTRDGMSIYVLSVNQDKEKRNLEGFIKAYCPNYTEKELAFDNEQTKAP